MSFVRSAYVFTPTAISNCALWLDGADPAGTGVVPAAGNLATWVDKSTSANNAIAGTAVYPQYNTAFLNNLGVVGLTNAADYFTVANNLNSASLTYVFVMKPTTANTGGYCGLLSTDTPGIYGRSIALNNMVFQLEYYNGFTATSITTNSSTWYIVSVVFTDGDVKKAMPHLKGISNAIALESIRELFESYLIESGHEIMWQLLNDNGWNIGGQNFIDDGGW